jgi:hypothetical protein
MEHYAGHYRGYKIDAQLDTRWIVRVEPTRPDLPILSFATFRLPSDASLFEVIDNARARIDAILTIDEIGRENQRNEDEDHA